ncbi:uncharacterized protein LOC141599274 [Silene latifolia]|uniref:uncharacterized protein LOC141599274 n=1 Tax=Silene latifolia TaxID=37657 RepID=UPI003D77F40B
MQRQSLGSPTRERLVLSPNDTVLTPDDLKRRDSSPPPFLTSSSIADADDEIKPEKPHRSYSSPEKFIHLVPLFIFLCFLILYLFSHDPSPQDLAQFHGFNFKQVEEIIEMNDIDEIGRIEKNHKQLKRSRAFVVRSLRNLEEEEEEDEIIERDEAKVRSHRKLGDF